MDRLKIFLVEDNYGDERLIKEALTDSGCGSSLTIARDGIEALLYLRKTEPHSEASRPDIILLDVNLPKKSGLEVLAEIKSVPDWDSIPVLMLTTSDSGSDRTRSLELNANDYIRKPVDLHEFLKLIVAMERTWIERLSLTICAGPDLLFNASEAHGERNAS